MPIILMIIILPVVVLFSMIPTTDEVIDKIESEVKHYDNTYYVITHKDKNYKVITNNSVFYATTDLKSFKGRIFAECEKPVKDLLLSKPLKIIHDKSEINKLIKRCKDRDIVPLNKFLERNMFLYAELIGSIPNSDTIIIKVNSKNEFIVFMVEIKEEFQ